MATLNLRTTRAFLGLAVFLLLGLLALLASRPDALIGTEVPAESPTESSVQEDRGAYLKDSSDSPSNTSRTPAERTEERLGEPHEAEYGPLLERSQSLVRLLLEDARGVPLHRFGTSAHLVRTWRQEGDAWHRVQSSLPQGGEITLGRTDGGGLEPGKYETVVSMGSYGVARATYNVARNKETLTRMSMPGWRRVVTLRLIDQDGHPLPYLSPEPHFRTRLSEVIPLRAAKASPLRSPWTPAEPPQTQKPPASRIGGRYFDKPELKVCPTDGGQFHVEVVAGVGGYLALYLDRRLFVTRYVNLSGNFAGPEWDNREVRVEVQPEYATLVASAGKFATKDPGRRSLLGAPPDPEKGWRPDQAPADRNLFDPAGLRFGLGRLLIYADAGTQPYVVYRSLEPFAARPSSEGPFWAEYHHSYTPTVAASDGAFHRTAPVGVPLKAGEVSEHHATQRAHPTVLSVKLSPTLAAWSRHTTFAIGSADRGLRASAAATGEVSDADRRVDKLRYDTALTLPWREAIEETGVTLSCGMSAEASGRLSYNPSNGKVQTGEALRVDVDLTLPERIQLIGGKLELDLQERMPQQAGRTLLAFRCVGEQGQGLPRVDVSILPIGEDLLAQQVRAASQRLAREDRRPGLESLGIQTVEGGLAPSGPDALEAAPSPATSPTAQAPGLSEAASAEYTQDGLDRLRSHGAWYDTRRLFRSNSDGYVVQPDVPLMQGELYVLYLWSSSKDDLLPDRRIVFQATGGITDLGVLRTDRH